MDADLVRSKLSEKVAEVGSEWERPGGEPMEEVVWMLCDDFSESFLRLMMVLMSSLCCLLASLLLHHMGRLYSQQSPKCLHAVHIGVPSSHFFLLNLQV